MCGIAGFSSYEEDYGICRGKWEEILETMNQVQKRRGPDEDGIFSGCSLWHGSCASVYLGFKERAAAHVPAQPGTNLYHLLQRRNLQYESTAKRIGGRRSNFSVRQ